MDVTHTPVDVYIINAAGFGRSLMDVAQSDPAHGNLWEVKGFLDSRTELGATSPLPIVGDPLLYRYNSPDYILCAVGDPVQRRKYTTPLLAQGANFINLTPDFILDGRFSIGHGCIFERNVKVGIECQLGDFVIFLANSIVGYQVKIGSFCTIGSFVFIGGGANIGSDVMIHTHSTILPKVKIGDGAVIGAGSVVIGDVPAGVTVLGNPAKRFRFR